ncbi:hypothetical protein [Propionibacterium australiense]|uniref:hypothetical protein n=1 Tax=Propionibacterium australiense TaxID=119981 RepID=UPI001E2A7D88|nr:hypothetical protein [Propionibacterium australiense]
MSGPDIDAESHDAGDLAVEDNAWQPFLADAPSQQAAQFAVRLPQHDLMPSTSKPTGS